MKFEEFFCNEYIEIKATGYNVISSFIEEIEGTPTKRYIEPLKTVFMHKTFNEMFLILDCTDLNLMQINSECRAWENNVLNYVNFGEEYTYNKKFLKYNIVLIILCKDLPEKDDDIFRSEIEKSKTICRKIFILTDDEGNIFETNKTMLPFYFEPIEKTKNDDINEYEKKLKDILPKDEEVSNILQYKEKLSNEDEKKILRWLEKYE